MILCCHNLGKRGQIFFFSSRRRHTRCLSDWSSDVCSSDLRSLMLVTALSPVIGYDKASKIAHYAMDNDLTLKVAALKLGFVTEEEFDRVVDPAKMVKPYVAAASGS